MAFDEALTMRIYDQVACPKCGVLHAWLGDHGACIALFGRCLRCLLEEHPAATLSPTDEVKLDRQVADVIEQREMRERATGRRVFPCVLHVETDCPRCRGRGWVVGYPPGFGQNAPS